MSKKIKVYSLLTRVFGNSNIDTTFNGSLEQNGIGKMSDIDDEFLTYIAGLGFTHLWAIGLIRHSTKTDLSYLGLENDPIEIVKGEAGSPYAIKDYYDIMPLLADEPRNRWVEFDALLKRVHRAGLKMMIDFVPNHLSRAYKSEAKADDIADFGENDNENLAFDNQNNFYYIVNEKLHLPNENSSYSEFPAKATGNDVFSAYPSANDWYETIKLNYGVDYLNNRAVFDPLPDTWKKMYQILDFWASKGVDAFRCDMAEMLPVEFWAWVLPKLKSEYLEEDNREIIFLAEIYQREKYRPFINAGFDYLYDKVAVYDTLKSIIKCESPAYNFAYAREETADIQDKMCYFLENHDEERLASDFFASDPFKGLPAMALLLLSSKSSYLHYFAQELGEKGMQREGFSGLDGRTSIFDYSSIDKMIRFRKGKFSNKHLQDDEKNLLAEYEFLLNISKNDIFDAEYYAVKRENIIGSDDKIFAFFRYNNDKLLLILANFANYKNKFSIKIDKDLLDFFKIHNNTAYQMIDLKNENAEYISISTYSDIIFDIDANNYKVLELKATK